MFALAWLLLPDLPDYRTGLIIVGLAPCIAMVPIWNDLADGDRETRRRTCRDRRNHPSIRYALLGWFYLEVLPAWIGLLQTALTPST